MIKVNNIEIPFFSGITVLDVLKIAKLFQRAIMAVYVKDVYIKNIEDYKDINLVDGDSIKVIFFMEGG